MTGLIDRRHFLNFDWLLLVQVLLLSFAGLYTVNCAVEGSTIESQFWRQISWFALGLVALLIIIAVDYHVWARFTWLFYSISIILLILLFVKGGVGGGGHVDRWLRIGFLPPVQPSEFVKLSLIMALAQYFHRMNRFELSLRDLIIPVILAAVPFLLVVSQPDLGTAMSLVPVCIILFLVAGYRFRNMLIVGFLIMIPTILAGQYVLKPYQIRRLTTFINPQADIKGAGWHTVMSKISVGSGELIGKVGSETRLYQRGFLPEQHTDFIFSVWAEETGFIGSIFIILLFTLLMRRGLIIAQEAKEPLGIYLAMGIITMIGFQAFFNIGMVLGVLPITGLPLPFFSYGGSHVLMTFASIGILLNIRMRRYLF